MGTGRRFADRQGKTGKVNPAHVFEQFLTHIVLTAGGGGRVRNGFRHVREAYGFSFARDSVCRIAGGGTASKLWVQILADITGVKLECMRDGVEAPMGDAFMADVAGGVFAGFEEIDSWTKSYMVFCPNWQNHELYNRYYEIYKHVYTSVKDDMHMLAGLGFSFE